MASNSRKRPNLNTNYEESILKEEQNARRDFFNDDDIENDENINENNRGYSYYQGRSKNSKVGELRNTVNAKREAEGSLPDFEKNFDGSLKTKTGRRKSAFFLGIVITVFAVIGFFNVVFWIGSGISAVIHDDSRLKKYDNVIAPVVYFDPAPFESWQGADAQTLVYICVWETISDNSSSDYEMNENGRVVIPVSDIASTAKRIFGSDIILDYNGFADEEAEIYYNSQTNNLEVLSAGVEGFEHKVLSVDKKKDVITAVVGYIEPFYEEDQSKTESGGFSKKMIYILKKDSETDNYYVSAVREYTE